MALGCFTAIPVIKPITDEFLLFGWEQDAAEAAKAHVLVVLFFFFPLT